MVLIVVLLSSRVDMFATGWYCYDKLKDNIAVNFLRRENMASS